jgi:hypothetical protein
VKLLVNNTKSPRVKKKIQVTFVMKSRAMGSFLRSMFDVTLPGSLGIVIYQDHYGEKNSCPCNDAMKIQTHKSR